MSGSNDKDNKLNPELGLWYGAVKITKHGGLDLETVHALYITTASSFFTRHFGVLTQFLNPGNSIQYRYGQTARHSTTSLKFKDREKIGAGSTGGKQRRKKYLHLSKREISCLVSEESGPLGIIISS